MSTHENDTAIRASTLAGEQIIEAALRDRAVSTGVDFKIMERIAQLVGMLAASGDYGAKQFMKEYERHVPY